MLKILFNYIKSLNLLLLLFAAISIYFARNEKSYIWHAIALIFTMLSAVEFKSINIK
jgi:hypothetical protein